MRLLNKRQTVISSSLIIVMGTILSKCLGFCREWVMAYEFGVGTISDAFSLTNMIPTTIFVSLGTAISVNFIPFCTERDNMLERNKFTSNIINLSTLVLITGVVLIEIFGETVIDIFAPGADEQTKYIANRMLRIVSFSIFPIMWGNIIQGYSQVKNKFFMTAFYGVIVNIILIFFICVSNKDRYLILSIGYVFAYFGGAFALVLEAFSAGFKYSTFISIKEKYLKDILLLTLPLVAEDVSSSLSLVVDRILASYLGNGIISAVGYASTLGTMAAAIISSAIITVMYPVFSKYALAKEMGEFENIFRKCIHILCAILAPISAFMFFFSEEIVVLIFQHGNFNASSSKIVWETMAFYVIGMVPNGVQAMFIRGFYSLKETKKPMIIKVVALLSNVLMNILFVRLFGYIGIALSTTLSYIIALILLCIIFENKYKMVIAKESLMRSVKGISLTLVLAAVIKYLGSVLFPNYFLRIFLASVIYFGICLIIKWHFLDQGVKEKIINYIKKE